MCANPVSQINLHGRSLACHRCTPEYSPRKYPAKRPKFAVFGFPRFQPIELCSAPNDSLPQQQMRQEQDKRPNALLEKKKKKRTYTKKSSPK